MGRPPSNGGPSFRFTPAEVAEMEAILQAHKVAMPAREVLVSLADKFSASPERSGKVTVQMKQVWNWFQNRRYALRAKASKSPVKPGVSAMPGDNSLMLRNVPQAPQSVAAPSATFRPLPQAPQQASASSVQGANRNGSDTVQMEYEAKSARDGAWYDVSTFLSHRSLEAGDPEVLVRFAGFGPEEDEWVVVRKNVRQRSLPCESSECVAVLPGDLILCFQEGKEQALYFDAHVLDAQRRRHDVRGCRCRFLVRYDHDQSEEIVALRKICRRPETDYRLQQLHAVNETANVNQARTGANIHTGSTLRVYPPAETPQRQHRVDTVAPSAAEVPQKQPKVEPVTPAPVQVQQKQLKVEPAAPAPPVEVTPEKQYKIELLPPTPGVAPQTQHKVEPAVITPPVETPQEQPNVQPPAPGPPPDILQTHKTEPSEPAPPTEASQTPHKVEPLVPTASEEVPQVPCKEESLVTSPSSANAPDGVQIQVLQQPIVVSPPTNAPEVECQLPKVADTVSTNDIENSNAPPENASIITNDDAIATAAENSNVPQEEDSIMTDCPTDPVTGDTVVATEDAAAAVTTNIVTDTVVEIADVILEDVAATSNNAVDTVVGNSAELLEDATVTNNDAVGPTVGNADISLEDAGATSNDATNTAAGSADVSLEDAGATSNDAANTAAGSADVSLEDAALTIENPTSTIGGDDAQNMEQG